MKIYKVEIGKSARNDIEHLSDFLAYNMTLEGAWRYKEAMRDEILSLSIYADLYHTSRYEDVRRFHPKARRMVSHNKKWVYIFHVEDDVVIVDRIYPAKMIAK